MSGDEPETRQLRNPKDVYDGDYWRRKAMQTLQKADTLDSPKRDRLLKVATEYEKLALRAEARISPQNTSNS